MRWGSSIKEEIEETTSRPYFELSGEDPPGKKKVGKQSTQRGEDFSNRMAYNEKINNYLSGFLIGNESKTALLEIADEIGEIGKHTRNYLKFFKGVGVIGSGITTAYSISNVFQQIQKGENIFYHRDIYDAIIGSAGVMTPILVYVGLLSNPVGWGITIGATIYGIIIFVYDKTNK